MHATPKVETTQPVAQRRANLRNLTQLLGLGSVGLRSPKGWHTTCLGRQAFARGGPPLEIMTMSDPNQWNDVLNEAYAVVGILGVGGYIVAMLAL